MESKEIKASLESQRATWENTLSICITALEKGLEPHSVWLQEKEKAEKRIEEIDSRLKLYRK